MPTACILIRDKGWLTVRCVYPRVPNMFSSLPSGEHSLRKRMISNVYSKTYIQSSPALAAQARLILHERFLPALEGSVSGGEIDVYSLFLATVMDFISAYIWGIPRSTNFIDQRGYREHWLELYKTRNGYGFFPQEFPRLTAFFKRLSVSLYPSWVDAANEELAAWNTGLCRQTTRHLESGQNIATDTVDEPVVMKALLSGIRKEESRGETSPLYATAILQRDLTVQSELWDHVLAGQETAGLALTYLSWHMSQHPRLQSQLREELLLGLKGSSFLPPWAFSPGAHRPLPDPKRLDGLPLLHAVLMETLRLHAPIPGPQPRETPRYGARVGPYELPGGVRIAALAHTLHRDEGVFRESWRWDPSRWLEGNEDEENDSGGMKPTKRKEMNKQFWAFSSGGRMCIGSHFAMHGEHIYVLFNVALSTLVERNTFDTTRFSVS